MRVLFWKKTVRIE